MTVFERLNRDFVTTYCHSLRQPQRHPFARAYRGLSRISLIAAMRFIRDELLRFGVASPGAIPAKLQRMRDNVLRIVLPERRSSRVYPRAVKIKMSKFLRKRRLEHFKALK